MGAFAPQWIGPTRVNDNTAQLCVVLGCTPHGDYVMYADSREVQVIGTPVMCMPVTRWQTTMRLLSLEGE